MSWRTISFRKRMLVIMTLSGLIELLLLVAAGFTYLKVNQEHEMGEKALGVARFLAESEIVIEMVEAQQPEPYQESFRALTKAIGAAFIVIGDNQGVRLIHPVDERIGKPMKGETTNELWSKVSPMCLQLAVLWGIPSAVKRRYSTHKVTSLVWCRWGICSTGSKIALSHSSLF